MPNELLAGGGDEPVRSVNLALLVVALEHFEADALAHGVEVGEVDSVGNGQRRSVGDHECRSESMTVANGKMLMTMLRCV
eukprot:scaffold11400_cov134-Isochrysis_galbana.AAC.7